MWSFYLDDEFKFLTENRHFNSINRSLYSLDIHYRYRLKLHAKLSSRKIAYYLIWLKYVYLQVYFQLSVLGYIK